MTTDVLSARDTTSSATLRTETDVMTRPGRRGVLGVRAPLGTLPTLVLIGVAITWGISFSVVDGTTDALSAADLVFWRFGIAAVALSMLSRGTPRLPPRLLFRGVVLGGLLGAGFLLQTWALTETDAMMSGFLVGTLVVMAPVFAWALFKVRASRSTWCGVVVATAGLAVMSMRGGGVGPGEAATVLAAALWALHLVLLARWGRPGFALRLACVQAATVAVMALLSAAASGLVCGGASLPALPRDASAWMAVLFLALPATALALIAVSWAQPRITAARAAVALTLEPAASAATAAVLGTALDGRMILGGVLLLAAMLMVELGGRIPSRRLEKHLEPSVRVTPRPRP